MCVVVVVPAGVELSEETLRAMHSSNRDSWGFACFDPFTTPVPPNNPDRPLGYISIAKDVSNSDNMVQRYKQFLSIGKRREFPHLAHFRIRTSGQTDVANAHPFFIKNGALVHNGHFTGHSGGNFSDTYYWSKMFADDLPPGMSEEQKTYLGKLVGRYNKIAMLFNDGTTTIINEEAGSYLEDGTWVSNDYWKHRYSGAYSHMM